MHIERRLAEAVRKASARRMLADFAFAARLLERASSRDYLRGAVAAASSLTVRASLLTAIGA